MDKKFLKKTIVLLHYIIRKLLIKFNINVWSYNVLSLKKQLKLLIISDSIINILCFTCKYKEREKIV